METMKDETRISAPQLPNKNKKKNKKSCVNVALRIKKEPPEFPHMSESFLSPRSPFKESGVPNMMNDSEAIGLRQEENSWGLGSFEENWSKEEEEEVRTKKREKVQDKEGGEMERQFLMDLLQRSTEKK